MLLLLCNWRYLDPLLCVYSLPSLLVYKPGSKWMLDLSLFLLAAWPCNVIILSSPPTSGYQILGRVWHAPGQISKKLIFLWLLDRRWGKEWEISSDLMLHCDHCYVFRILSHKMLETCRLDLCRSSFLLKPEPILKLGVSLSKATSGCFKSHHQGCRLQELWCTTCSRA